MIASILEFLTTTLLPLGPLGVFGASLIEEIIAPIPSALVMLGSGFLFVQGPFSLENIVRLVTHVAIPISLGVALGSLVVYSVARYAGAPLLLKWGTLFGIQESDIENARVYFSKSNKDDIAIFIARVIPVVPAVVIAIGAGLIEMPMLRYIGISIAGTFIRALILGVIGWQTGSLYTEYASLIEKWENVVWIVLGIIGLGLVWRVFMRKKSL